MVSGTPAATATSQATPRQQYLPPFRRLSFPCSYTPLRSAVTHRYMLVLSLGSVILLLLQVVGLFQRVGDPFEGPPVTVVGAGGQKPLGHRDVAESVARSQPRGHLGRQGGLAVPVHNDAIRILAHPQWHASGHSHLTCHTQATEFAIRLQIMPPLLVVAAAQRVHPQPHVGLVTRQCHSDPPASWR